ncbi:MAG: PASTA domain-containing protein [Cytophagales bacterium]|nr:PASTA domain-containing protein [Cytophagales bacterium]
MFSKGSSSQLRYFILHILIWLVVFIGSVIGVFNFYIPYLTHRGETVTVPDVRGMSFQEIGSFLDERGFSFRVLPDSEFTLQEPPLTVLKQFPLPSEKVKEGRKIALVLNARRPPNVRLPQLKDGSLKNALVLLRVHRLALGKVKYISDLAENAVLKQFYKDKEMQGGEWVPQGASIDLEVGDGLGRRNFQTPLVVGLPHEEAELVIRGSGLRLQKIYSQKQITPEIRDILEVRPEDGTVYKQKPTPQTPIQRGDLMDIWIYQEKEEKQNPQYDGGTSGPERTFRKVKAFPDSIRSN